MKIKLTLMISFISVMLSSVFTDNPIFADYKTWVDNEDCTLLLHSKANYPNHSGTLKLISKRGGAVLFEKQVGFLTYIWMSPDSEFIVGFSNSQTFSEASGYNLIILNSSGENLHKIDIRHGSKFVKNVTESVSIRLPPISNH